MASHLLVMEFLPWIDGGISSLNTMMEKVRQIDSSLSESQYDRVHALWPHSSAWHHSVQAMSYYNQRVSEKYRSDPQNMNKFCWHRDRETHCTKTSGGDWKQVHIFDGEFDSRFSSALSTHLDHLAISYERTPGLQSQKGWSGVNVFVPHDLPYLCEEVDFRGQFHGQMWAELSVLAVLESLHRKRDGYFIDLAAHAPVAFSNTATLERDFDWRGLCIEGSTDLILELTKRRCTFSFI